MKWGRHREVLYVEKYRAVRDHLGIFEDGDIIEFCSRKRTQREKELHDKQQYTPRIVFRGKFVDGTFVVHGDEGNVEPSPKRTRTIEEEHK